jgi:lysozyme family protein
VQPAADFDRCLAVTLFEEDQSGLGLVTHDAGGTTRWGIASRYNPEVDVANLTREGAARIYRVKYWDALHCGDFPIELAMVVFDGAVNPGPGWAARALQRVLGVEQDGNVGRDTLLRAKTAGMRECVAFSDARLARFGESAGAVTNPGWRPRVLRVLYRAALMAAS